MTLRCSTCEGVLDAGAVEPFRDLARVVAVHGLDGPAPVGWCPFCGVLVCEDGPEPEPLKFADFNPDCMDIDEVRKHRDWLAADQARAAREWFPDERPELRLRRVANAEVYCYAKVRAMEFRLAGQIQSATAWERVCDLVYIKLPLPIRW